MTLVFALAYIGYLLLGATVATHCWHRPFRWLHAFTAMVVLLHVYLVWDWRFHWSLAYAWEKSVAGFLIFHTALALIVASALIPIRWARWGVLLAFNIVTAGAMAATVRYEEVQVYQWPMVVASLVIIGACLWGFSQGNWNRKD